MPDGWFDLFIRDAADRIKHAGTKDGGAFEKIWNAEQLAVVKAITEANAAVLGRLDTRRYAFSHERKALWLPGFGRS
jgi:hypothetical protein